MSGNLYDLVLLDWDVVSPPEAERILVEITGAPQLDANSLVSVCQGLLMRDLEAAKAEAAVLEFAAAGMHVVAQPSGTIQTLPTPCPVKNASLLPEYLEAAVDVYGNKDRVRWGDIAVVGAGQLHRRVTHIAPAGSPLTQHRIYYGLRFSLPPAEAISPASMKATRSFEESVRTCCLGIVAVNPLRHFRIEATQFNYAYLGERLSNSSAFNFAALVTDTLTLAPNAATNLAPEEMNGVATHWPVYGSPHDLEKRMAWMLWRRQLTSEEDASRRQG